MTLITGFSTHDVRFPTSTGLHGSDAMNGDPDYSAAYLILETDSQDLEGHSLVFTIGRGNDLQIAALELFAPMVVGLSVQDLGDNIGEISRQLNRDSQLRWLGPEKGVTQMAIGGVVNALWDLIAKSEGKPLWKSLADRSPEQIVDLVDFRYISDALSPLQALEIVKAAEDKKHANEARLRSSGVRAYTTTPGWLGYDDATMVRLCHEAVAEGYDLVKLKVGRSLEDDKRRIALAREALGPAIKLAVDANQVWDVEEAIAWINELSAGALYWVEEATSPDDIVGHAAIAEAVAPVRLATGEHVANRIMFKQMLQARSLSFMQIDATRVAGVNENVANILLAARFDVPVCPHAGGVGLCEMVQHLAMFDSVAVAGFRDDRYVEFVDHLHEHFVVPAVIADGNYVAPLEPGSGAEIHRSSIERFTYPHGAAWSEAIA
jgi:L-fuconate dehydratase